MKASSRSAPATSPSPRANKSLTIKTGKNDDKRQSFDKASPKRAQSPQIQKPKTVDIQAYDRIMFEQLGQVLARATESVTEGLNKIVSKLEFLQGPCPSHRMTACSQLFAHLLDDVNMTVFSDDKHRINVMRNEQSLVKEEASRLHEALSLKIAKKDQQISILEYDLATSETKNKTLSKTVELLERELEKSAHNLNETHQRAVELRMQGWDFKYEVDRRSDKILGSIQTRMGFVPAGIQKQVAQLKVLKPPGDPEYDLVRDQQASASSSKRRKAKKRAKSATASAMASSDNPMLAALLGGSGAQRQVTMNRFASTPTASEDGLMGPSVTTLASAAKGLSVSSPSAARTDPFHQYLISSAQEDLALVSSRLSPKGSSTSLPQGIAAVGQPHEHRRLSASSNASGYTDRRSSTSSSVPANGEDGEESGDDDEGRDASYLLAASALQGKGTAAWASLVNSRPFAASEEVAAAFEQSEDEQDDEARDEDFDDSNVYNDVSDDSSDDDSERAMPARVSSPPVTTAAAAASGSPASAHQFALRVSREKDSAGAKALRTASGSQSPGSSRIKTITISVSDSERGNESFAFGKGGKSMEYSAIPDSVPSESLDAPVPKCTMFETCCNMTSLIVGVGMLSLPYAALKMGWCAVLGLCMMSAIFMYMFRLLAECLETRYHSKVDSSEDDSIDYATLGKEAFGRNGDKVVMFFVATELGLALVLFLMNIGINVHIMNPHITYQQGVIGASLIAFVLSTMSLKYVAYSSFFGLAMTVLTLAAIVISGLLMDKIPANVDDRHYDFLVPTGVPLSLGVIALCFGGHSAFPKMYFAMEDRENHIRKALRIVCVVVAVAYGTAMIGGYYFYAQYVLAPVTLNIGRSLDLRDIPVSGAYLKIAAAAGITANLQVTCPLVLFPVRDITMRMMKLHGANTQLLIALAIVGLGLGLALAFEYHFAAVCGLIGSICTTFNSVVCPVLFYHTIHPKESIPPAKLYLHVAVVAIALSAAVAGIWSDFCTIFSDYC